MMLYEREVVSQGHSRKSDPKVFLCAEDELERVFVVHRESRRYRVILVIASEPSTSHASQDFVYCNLWQRLSSHYSK